MREIRVNYPWDRTPFGKGFFVPTLNLEQVRERGLKAAAFYGVSRGYAYFVVKGGKLGVWFTHGRPR